MYYVVAEKFGWTPLEADEQPAYLVDWMVAIAATIDEVKAENANPKSQSR